MSSRHYLALSRVLCLSFLAACSYTRPVQNLLPSYSPSQPVQDLAEKTAANAGVISAQLNSLAQESRQLGDLRAANIAQLHAANTRLRASYNYDLALTKKSGEQTDLNLIPELEKWLKEVEAIFAAADHAEKERKAAILATQTELDTKSEALAEVAQALATLAKEESATHRVKFLAGYAKELKGEIDARLKQNDKSATNAKKLLEGLKDELGKEKSKKED